MSFFRYPGPIGTVRDWFGDNDDAKVARLRSPSQSTVGKPISLRPSLVVASGVCAYLNHRSSGTVIASENAFKRLRTASGQAKVSTPQSKASQAWIDGSSTAAIELEITIDSQTIQLIRPEDTAASGKNLPTTSQLSEALRANPSAQRKHTKKVILSPVAHPKSTENRRVAGEAGSGEITLFPISTEQTQNDFDNRVMHESGHNYQESLWQSVADSQEWGIAAKADKRRPSPYAAFNFGEDFCEFSILFNAANGTPCEAVARQIYPNRWAKMLQY